MHIGIHDELENGRTVQKGTNIKEGYFPKTFEEQTWLKGKTNVFHPMDSKKKVADLEPFQLNMLQQLQSSWCRKKILPSSIPV